ncbi:MAG: hypothetical protein IIB02_07230 [Thaumarchaeota archaeon]|nr:hypothetical protein [Nitrososphaerota archaeon]
MTNKKYSAIGIMVLASLSIFSLFESSASAVSENIYEVITTDGVKHSPFG